MEKKQEIVHFQLDAVSSKPAASNKALQIKVDNNRTIIVYNHINSYILDALFKPVF